MDARERCAWASTAAMVAYHDTEWGVPHHDDRALFELLTLEGAQAGLSWSTVLARRDGYRKAFLGFDPGSVAALDEAAQERLMGDPGIIRNRAKIRATVANAAAFVEVQRSSGSFDRYLWDWVDGAPVVGRFADGQLPATTPLAEAVSRDLRRRGFSFVGPTIVYAFLQASGVVMDHTPRCFRFAELA